MERELNFVPLDVALLLRGELTPDRQAVARRVREPLILKLGSRRKTAEIPRKGKRGAKSEGPPPARAAVGEHARLLVAIQDFRGRERRASDGGGSCIRSGCVNAIEDLVELRIRV
jgi:hypothetical protein